MRLLAALVVLLVDLDGLVGFGRDQTRSRVVERHREDAGFGVHGARLDGGLQALEVVAGPPVPEMHRSVVAARDQNALGVHGHAVDDRVVTGQVLNEISFGATPLFDVVGTRRGEHVQSRMQNHASNAFLVVCQCAHALAGRQVPKPYSRVMAAGDDLRVGCLRHHAGDCVCMTAERVDVRLRSHVPNASCRVSAGRDENVKRRMKRHAVDSRQVTVIVPNDFVVLEIPALDLSVFSAREQVRMARRDCESSNCADVTGERELQFSTRQIPNLDDSIGGASREPFVAWFDCDASNPTQVTADDSIELPRRVPFRLRNR